VFYIIFLPPLLWLSFNFNYFLSFSNFLCNYLLSEGELKSSLSGLYYFFFCFGHFRFSLDLDLLFYSLFLCFFSTVTFFALISICSSFSLIIFTLVFFLLWIDSVFFHFSGLFKIYINLLYIISLSMKSFLIWTFSF